MMGSMGYVDTVNDIYRTMEEYLKISEKVDM